MCTSLCFCILLLLCVKKVCIVAWYRSDMVLLADRDMSRAYETTLMRVLGSSLWLSNLKLHPSCKTLTSRMPLSWICRDVRATSHRYVGLPGRAPVVPLLAGF
jgi:hypothetical protein